MPYDSLIDDAMSHVYPAALRAAVLLRIADHLADGPLPLDQLAQRTEAEPDNLQRVLRLLATHDLFTEPHPGVHALTPRGEKLHSTTDIAQAIAFQTSPVFWNSSIELHHAVTTGEAAFNRVHGKSFFDYVAANPGVDFDRGMSAFSRLSFGPAVAAYPWPKTGTVVDVGGGHGGLLLETLRANPGLHGVLYEQNHVLADHVLDTPETHGRWVTESGDFFTAAPSGDIYTLKAVLHDWNDDECVQILSAVARAANSGARVLVIESVLPDTPDGPHNGYLHDLLMMALVTGKERTRDEYEALFTKAGITLNRVIDVPGTAVSTCEGVIA